VARRPNDKWAKRVAEEAAALARGSLSPDDASAVLLWPELLRSRTDSVLAAFEDQLRALVFSSDEEVMGAVRLVVLALNEVNERQGRAGSIGYETDEREELCAYIDASLEESGIDVRALEHRRGMDRGEITDTWRDW
jgi:hypothetical protein